jgi:hypothetical protein
MNGSNYQMSCNINTKPERNQMDCLNFFSIICETSLSSFFLRIIKPIPLGSSRLPTV